MAKIYYNRLKRDIMKIGDVPVARGSTGHCSTRMKFRDKNYIGG